jgi:D-alanine-D-alanine ligase
MIIGLTYDLRSDYLKEGYSHEETAEFDKEETIAGIENAIQNAGFETERIGHARQLMTALSAGKKWDLVFNIAEGMYGEGRESLIPALLDSYKIPYVFSGPVTLGVSLNKAFTKHIVRDAGILTPDFFVVYKVEDIENCKLEYPLFAKPIAEGTGKGIENKSVIKDKNQLKVVCTSLLKTFKQAVLVERFLPGREFTTGIVGNGNEASVVGSMEVVYGENTSEIYSMFNKENYEDRISYRLPDDETALKCAEISLKVWNILNANDGGRVDLRMDENGNVNFLEINPLAGLNPIHSDLPLLSKLNNLSYQELMNRILNASIKRNQL